MWWATAMSLLCATCLWYSAYLVDVHTSELHKIINYSADAVVVCGADGTILYANAALSTITGFSEQDLREGGVSLLIPEFMRAAHRDGIKRAKIKSARGIEGVNYRSIYPVLRKDGAAITCRVSVGTVRHLGGPQFFAFITPVAVPGAGKEKPAQLPRESVRDSITTLPADFPR
jgi:PAS domain S-box-containing protein